MTAPEPKMLDDVEFVAIDLIPDPNGRLRAWTTVRDRTDGRVYKIRGGLLLTTTAP